MGTILKTVTVVGVIMLAFGMSQGSRGDGDFADARRDMLRAVQADYLRNPDVTGRNRLSPAVEAALRKVPRHEFVPHTYRTHAYENRALPIGLGQTISQPTIVAMMTDLLELAPGDTVLEVGTGSGYQAAVLGEVLTDGYVHTIEIVTDLARTARMRLRTLGYDNVEVYEGDGYAGLPEVAPFAGIMVTAAAAEVPTPLIEQLAPGARLVMPVGAQDDIQWLTVLEKGPDGDISRRRVLPVRFVPLTRHPE
jgi:protein-L-isoaspartate(D-aspartate) O-methyltransferase